MVAAAALARFAHALGRYQSGWRFVGSELRQAVALANVAATWDAFRRDAGAGIVGPAHEVAADSTGITASSDPRRDAVLSWQSDHGPPGISEAARTVARMIGGKKRFSECELVLLDIAREALTQPAAAQGPVMRALAAETGPDSSPLRLLGVLAMALDRLREDAAFVEAGGSEVRHAFPSGIFSHYVAPEPGATWALGLAVTAQAAPIIGAPPVPGLVSRALLRSDLATSEVTTTLVDGATIALDAGFALIERLESELSRGRDALAHMSRNARTRNAWVLVAGLRSFTRAQLGRALGLSRAGADIQARALANAGLVTLWPGGRIVWHHGSPAVASQSSLEVGPLGQAGSELDHAMADIDRLLARMDLPETHSSAEQP